MEQKYGIDSVGPAERAHRQLVSSLSASRMNSALSLDETTVIGSHIGLESFTMINEVKVRPSKKIREQLVVEVESHQRSDMARIIRAREKLASSGLLAVALSTEQPTPYRGAEANGIRPLLAKGNIVGHVQSLPQNENVDPLVITDLLLVNDIRWLAAMRRVISNKQY